jgi:hypothetical protein
VGNHALIGGSGAMARAAVGKQPSVPQSLNLHDPPILFLTLRGNTFVHQSCREGPFDSLSY